MSLNMTKKEIGGVLLKYSKNFFIISGFAYGTYTFARKFIFPYFNQYKKNLRQNSFDLGDSLSLRMNDSLYRIFESCREQQIMLDRLIALQNNDTSNKNDESLLEEVKKLSEIIQRIHLDMPSKIVLLMDNKTKNDMLCNGNEVENHV
ncbi:hypothetical protein A3Q56_07624 [Intoshia linei]|uniref:Uncharacterized protein n=1 Tax=Intoshia linei TaxID=1819745 RepID=A0A177AS60_9BILA|nr:hypothetical protein A3Q56_07624 [Intoshia linei]